MPMIFPEPGASATIHSNLHATYILPRKNNVLAQLCLCNTFNFRDALHNSMMMYSTLALRTKFLNFYKAQHGKGS